MYPLEIVQWNNTSATPKPLRFLVSLQSLPGSSKVGIGVVPAFWFLFVLLAWLRLLCKMPSLRRTKIIKIELRVSACAWDEVVELGAKWRVS
jgi:hypothetical protein